MMFTYEWCDWRNGLFFWVQGVEGDDLVLKEMKAFLTQYCKTDLKYKWCGVRLQTEKRVHDENAKLIDLFGLTSSHYYIYHMDVQAE